MKIRSNIKELNAKLANGDSLTNADLRKMRDFYAKLLHMLSELGPEADLMVSEYRRRLMKVEDFISARKTT